MSIGFSPGQVHYGFSVTKEMTIECFGGERVIPNFISTVAGQSLESCRLRMSLHAARRSLPLGLSAPTAVSVSALHAATTSVSSLLSCSFAAVPPCHAQSTSRTLYYIESTAMYCPQVCSELANQGQVRILATGTFILSTPSLTEAEASCSHPPPLEPIFAK